MVPCAYAAAVAWCRARFSRSLRSAQLCGPRARPAGPARSGFLWPTGTESLRP